MFTSEYEILAMEHEKQGDRLIQRRNETRVAGQARSKVIGSGKKNLLVRMGLGLIQLGDPKIGSAIKMELAHATIATQGDR